MTWKYVHYRDEKEFLNDLKNDPEEITNLAANPELLNKKQELNEELVKLLKKKNYKF